MGSYSEGGRVSVWADGKVPETGSDNSCTTMWMYLLSLNCNTKMVKMVNFMFYMFYHNQKILRSL